MNPTEPHPSDHLHGQAMIRMSVPAHQLRAWAQGDYPTEAAVEMLIRAHGGRFARTSCPWINHVEDSAQMCRVDWDRLHDESGTFSGGERRFLRIAISLGSPDHPVDLSNNIAGLDRELLELVLAGVAHAAGSHDWPVLTPRTITPTDGTEPFQVQIPTNHPAGSRHPWPPHPGTPTADPSRAFPRLRRPEDERHGTTRTAEGHDSPRP